MNLNSLIYKLGVLVHRAAEILSNVGKQLSTVQDKSINDSKNIYTLSASANIFPFTKKI